MKQERMYYGVYAIIDPEHHQKLTDLILSHKGKQFGQDDTIFGIFGKAHYAAQAALLFLQDCLKEPTCTYSVLILKGTQASLVKDAKLMMQELAPGCCMITEPVLHSLQVQNPKTENWGPVTTASGERTTLYTLQGCGDIMLDDEAAASLFDFSGVEQEKPKSDELAPEPVRSVESDESELELEAEPSIEEPEVQEEPNQAPESINDSLEVASVNQIYAPPAQDEAAQDTEIAIQDDPEATEPPFEPNTMPAMEAPIERPSVKNTPLSEPTSEHHPSPTVTQGYAMPHFPDPWHVRWRSNPQLFWGSIIAGGFFFLIIIWIAIPKTPEPQPILTIEEEEMSLFDDQPLYPEKEEKPAYQTVLTRKEAKNNVLDIEKTMFPQVPGPNTAFMEILSRPEGATVTINGKTLAKKTPLTTFLVPANKKLAVKVSKPGHLNAERDVTIKKQQRRGLLFILTEE